MAGAGLGFAIFDALPAALFDARSVAVRAFEPALALRYFAHWSHSRSEAPERAALVALAREALLAISESATAGTAPDRSAEPAR